MPELKDDRKDRTPGYIDAFDEAERATRSDRRRRLGPVIVLRDDVPGRTVAVELWNGFLPEHGIAATIRAGSPSELRDDLVAYLRGDVRPLQPGDRARVVVPSANGLLARGDIVRVIATEGLPVDEVAIRTDKGSMGRMHVEQLARIDEGDVGAV